MTLPPQAPSAPRAMREPKTYEVDFASKFNLLAALGSVHAGDQLDDLYTVSDNATKEELLQGFLNGISYLCDTEKGGNTVTAAALGDDNVLYMAANENLHPSIQKFIKNLVLCVLKNSNSTNRSQISTTILRQVIELASKSRMKYYSRQFALSWEECRQSLDDQFRGTPLLSWIEKLANLAKESIGLPSYNVQNIYYSLVDQCYEGRTKEVKELRLAASTTEDIDIRGKWVRLIHYIGRLGAHKCHVLNIFSAYSRIPVLREIQYVIFLASSQRRPLELPESSFDIAILGSSIADNLERPAAVRKHFFSMLMERYFDFRELTETLRKNKKINTRVHAELVVLGHIKRQGIRFYKGYKYIGSSKPACYFCYYCMKNEGLVTPRSHFTVHLECRGPDFSGSAEKVGDREKLYKRLCEQVDEDISKHFLDPVVSSGNPHFQSSNGSRRAIDLASISNETSSRI